MVTRLLNRSLECHRHRLVADAPIPSLIQNRNSRRGHDTGEHQCSSYEANYQACERLQKP